MCSVVHDPEKPNLYSLNTAMVFLFLAMGIKTKMKFELMIVSLLCRFRFVSLQHKGKYQFVKNI